MTTNSTKRMYFFLDEGGDLNFPPKGSRYFTISGVILHRPFTLNTALDTYKYNLHETGINNESFHCSYDYRHVQHQVFEILQKNVHQLHIESLLVDKAKISGLRYEPHICYSKLLCFFIRRVITTNISQHEDQDIGIITDSIPWTKKRRYTERLIADTLEEMMPANVQYTISHHSSRAHYGLQVADYCNWAIFRKWEQGDDKYYQMIRPAIKSEHDILDSTAITIASQIFY